MNPLLGIILHSIGGLASGSFYLPYKKVRKWAWETYWLTGGFFAWILAPWVVAFLTAPGLISILRQAPARSIGLCYLFGLLWGIGGLTFGLSMRYLGMSLGYALALGFCAAFGTVIPPIAKGEFGGLVTSLSGLTTLAGVVICLGGIAVCGWAGILKENELSEEKKKETIKEFSFVKGVWVAIFAGVMSACMAFGIEAGEQIADLAVDRGVAPVWQNSPVFVCILAGGFTTNFIWCVLLNIKNRTTGNYVRATDASLAANYLFCAMAGVTWYLQFMFYGMGTTKMGRYGFSSWSIHMAFIIVFSNIWGLLLKEWRGSSRRTHGLIFLGIIVLILSTAVMGLGSYFASRAPSPGEFYIWDDRPVEQATAADLETADTAQFDCIDGIDEPTLTYFPAQKPNGTAVVVCPGGGYGKVCYGKEGIVVARWLNKLGITAFVLRYRLPKEGYVHPIPLQDAKRAIRLVRSDAGKYGIDPARIGIMGFSAGGHLASTTGTHLDEGDTTAEEAIDRVSARPDFMILVYPVITFEPPYAHMGSRNNLLGEQRDDQQMVKALSNNLQVTDLTPPNFLAHAKNDFKVPVENSIFFNEACKQAGVPSELKIYQEGGHGFSLGREATDSMQWTTDCEQWLRKSAFIE
ncbi:MAG: L-rhamnose/proton symporter RhaT [Planctomycetota bacterium]|jgi:L-rhamnose-H+ transport protein